LSSRDASLPIQTDLSGIPILPIVLLVTLPLLSVMGTSIYLNLYNNVYPNIVLFFLVAVTPLLLVTQDFDRRGVIIAVWAVSIAVLLNMGLVSQYVWGFDIHLESFISRRVLRNGVWEMTFQNKINTMATYAIVAPVYVMFTGLSLPMVFKVLFAVLFSIVPVGIYLVSEAVFDRRVP
jgi:uncharacterized membrane protein